MPILLPLIGFFVIASQANSAQNKRPHLQAIRHGDFIYVRVTNDGARPIFLSNSPACWQLQFKTFDGKDVLPGMEIWWRLQKVSWIALWPTESVEFPVGPPIPEKAKVASVEFYYSVAGTRGAGDFGRQINGDETYAMSYVGPLPPDEGNRPILSDDGFVAARITARFRPSVDNPSRRDVIVHVENLGTEPMAISRYWQRWSLANSFDESRRTTAIDPRQGPRAPMDADWIWLIGSVDLVIGTVALDSRRALPDKLLYDPPAWSSVPSYFKESGFACVLGPGLIATIK